jgi:hypothetical protein
LIRERVFEVIRAGDDSCNFKVARCTKANLVQYLFSLPSFSNQKCNQYIGLLVVLGEFNKYFSSNTINFLRNASTIQDEPAMMAYVLALSILDTAVCIMWAYCAWMFCCNSGDQIISCFSCTHEL